MDSPAAAAAQLRTDEQRRLREIRQLVITVVNGVPVRVEDVVDGGRALPGEICARGVVVGHRTRTGRVGISQPLAGVRGPDDNPLRDDQDDCVQGVIHVRTGEDAAAAWNAVRAKIDELNGTPGKLLPGVRLETYLEGGEAPKHFWVHATLPLNTSLERATTLVREARAVVGRHPETDKIVSEIGGPDDGVAAAGTYKVRLFVGLKPEHGRLPELMEAIQEELEHDLPGTEWDCSLEAREGLWGEFGGTLREPVLKIFGPDLHKLQELAFRAKEHLAEVPGIRSVQIAPVMGRTDVEFRVDLDKCARWGVSPKDVTNAIQSALDAPTVSTMLEGDKIFDITLRWPQRFRRDEQSILDLPVDIPNNAVEIPGNPAKGLTPSRAGALAPVGQPLANTPRLRLRDLVSPVGDNGEADPKGAFTRLAPAAIYRENGKRLILLRLNIPAGDPNRVRAEAQNEMGSLLQPPYWAEWSP
jgi:cobalt-zinc-cadmium resistance protein CzcA